MMAKDGELQLIVHFDCELVFFSF